MSTIIQPTTTTRTLRLGPPMVNPTLDLRLRAGDTGLMLGCETVAPGDLMDLNAELWLESCLRHGDTEIPQADVPIKFIPVFRVDQPTNDGKLQGFVLEATHPRTHVITQRVFAIPSLNLVAERVASRLLASGELQPTQSYSYEVVLNGSPAPAPATGSMKVKFRPLQVRRLPLAPLQAKSERVGNSEDDDAFPVFVTRTAFARAERFSRRGAQSIPPQESGAILVGCLASCPESGAFFVIVFDVLEVKDAAEKPLSLTYTDVSWGRLTAILSAMQQAHPDSALRFVGQAHGHNFTPDDGTRCASCEHRATYTKTSALPSVADQRWMRAVFPQQPFALCWIFGLSARNETVHGLFGWRSGQLVERDFWLLPEFSSSESPTPEMSEQKE
jgi:hypothetical protein